MEHPSPLLLLLAVNRLVNVMPKALLIATILVSTPNPIATQGRDSSRAKYFNGYHLYMISAANSYYDLPLYPRPQPASRHDAVSLVVSSVEFKQRFNLGTVEKMLLDAAHDAEAIYRLLDFAKGDSHLLSGFRDEA